MEMTDGVFDAPQLMTVQHVARDANDEPMADAHVAREIGNGRVRLEVEEMSLSAVRAALLNGRAAASGVEGRHIDVAKSQRTKLKKRGAGPEAYGKWALFAVKCAVEDLFRRGK